MNIATRISKELGGNKFSSIIALIYEFFRGFWIIGIIWACVGLVCALCGFLLLFIYIAALTFLILLGKAFLLAVRYKSKEERTYPE